MPSALIVDDAIAVRAYLAEQLEAVGFDTVAAANGLEALERCLTDDFALLVVDINMPVMDGYAFVSALRASREAASAFAPVVMVSTEDQPDDAAKAYAAGANVYLTKPVPGDLLASWARMLVDLPDPDGDPFR